MVYEHIIQPPMRARPAITAEHYEFVAYCHHGVAPPVQSLGRHTLHPSSRANFSLRHSLRVQCTSYLLKCSQDIAHADIEKSMKSG